MTCTTFLHDSELNQQLPDAEVQAILDEVRKLSGENWQVVPLPAQRPALFRKKQPTLYGVYVYVGGIGPWQQINFWRDGAKSSINLYATLEVVAAYLLGLLGGCIKPKVTRRINESNMERAIHIPSGVSCQHLCQCCIGYSVVWA